MWAVQLCIAVQLSTLFRVENMKTIVCEGSFYYPLLEKNEKGSLARNYIEALDPNKSRKLNCPDENEVLRDDCCVPKPSSVSKSRKLDEGDADYGSDAFFSIQMRQGGCILLETLAGVR